ncbi:hypothetical protein SAMN05661044_00259 [Olivibacter domesticus]|uniref:Uncharacterized protein n=1 Tax=Olivibacter domesticus TaxID=407022 RepID=A0A1H7H5X4_OLID1|nr:hypothetical protein SAMN05661044_00259 [Olivibacter domesticus]
MLLVSRIMGEPANGYRDTMYIKMWPIDKDISIALMLPNKKMHLVN